MALRRRPMEIVSLTGLRIASPLIAAAIMVAWGAASWQSTLHNAEAEARSRVTLLETQVAGVIGAQFVLHDAITVRLAEIDPAAVQGWPFHAFLKALFETTSQTYGIGLVALDGRLLASSGEYPATSRIEGRGYMEDISAGAGRVIDRIALASRNVDAMASATAVSVGREQAALLTAWPVDSLIGFTGGLAVRDGHEALVMRADGRILVMSGTDGVTTLSPDHPLLATVQDRPDGLLHAAAPKDGKASLVAYRTVDDLPLLVAYSISMDSIRRDWLTAAAPFLALAAAGGLFSYLLFGMIRDRVDTRLRRAVADQRAEAAENLARHRNDLLREMNHRIKNNLAITASIIRIEGRSQPHLTAADLAKRIDAVATVHDMLYRADDGMTADVGKLLDAIATNPAIVPSELGVAVTLDLLPDVSLDSSVATALAMIVSEIITNAVKHAFMTSPDPRLDIGMAETGGQLVVTLRDNGPGAPAEPARRSGSELMQALASSAGIRIEADTDGGMAYRLRLDRPAPATAPTVTTIPAAEPAATRTGQPAV